MKKLLQSFYVIGMFALVWSHAQAMTQAEQDSQASAQTIRALFWKHVDGACRKDPVKLVKMLEAIHSEEIAADIEIQAFAEGLNNWLDNIVIDSIRDDLGNALHHAASLGYDWVCKLLIEVGISVESVNNDGFTPLSVAACEGHKNTCKILLRDGLKDPFDVAALADQPLDYVVVQEALIALDEEPS